MFRRCTKIVASLALVTLSLAACAQSEPYRRLEPGPATEVPLTRLVEAYNTRWPAQFKSSQTVTLDFGPVTRTFSALLIVQQPGCFRLQGMTEQGLKIFDLARDGAGDHVIFKGDDMGDQAVAQISRDIQRVFLDGFIGVPSASTRGSFQWLEGNTPSLTLRAKLAAQGQNLLVDCTELRDESGRLYALDSYEWTDTGGFHHPQVIVLRDSGRQSGSYPYKLTLKINELAKRAAPWPEKTFRPKD